MLKKLTKLMCITALFALCVFATGPFVYKIIFPSYLESIPYFRVLTLLILFAPFQLLEASLLATMRQKALYIIQTTVSVLRIILFLILVPLYGVWGIIYSTLIAKMLDSSLLFYFFCSR